MCGRLQFPFLVRVLYIRGRDVQACIAAPQRAPRGYMEKRLGIVAALILFAVVSTISPAVRGNNGARDTDLSGGAFVSGRQTDTEMTKGLQFRLSQGDEQADKSAAAPVSSAEPLAAADTESVLKRLAPLKADSA